MAFYSVLGFHFSHAIDESGLNELVGKKVQEALAKEKAKAKHQRVDKSAFFAGLGYSGMFSWNLAYKDSFVLLPHSHFNFGGRLLERKDPSTILNGFNFKVGYQYAAPVKIKKWVLALGEGSNIPIKRAITWKKINTNNTYWE
ncbi:hypothetical protein [Helicobacter pylori]|uniref:hypothetical protein n=1 Tax=Helicobacter pylori TaxID=210 RepID=UPI001E489AF8|nr:hypothetical protein [Helicobacter pylori]